jgi:uncharacterized protein YecE (DUF72 family)
MKAHVGTSGWMYKHWNDKFFPASLPKSKWFNYYTEYFDTVEINSTFYHFARSSTFQKWKKDSPSKFIYAIKLNRLFTRYKRLQLDKETRESLRNFLTDASLLKSKLGPILIQLPPGLKCDLKLLATFLLEIKDLGKELNKNFKLAIEFRHKSWLNPEVYKLLKKNKAAFVISDSPRWPTEIIKTTSWVYLRLHGKPKLFSSDYSQKSLNQWRKELLMLKPTKIFVYFNNDANAHAADNALYLKRTLN